MILKDLNKDFGLKNILASDQDSKMTKDALDPEYGTKSIGGSVANGFFHMFKNESQLLWNAMAYVANSLETELSWSSLGSTPLTRALRDLCGIKPGEFAYQFITGKRHTLHPESISSRV